MIVDECVDQLKQSWLQPEERFWEARFERIESV
jgi:hypothetical protein